jgi:hypothetical protein
MMNREIIVLEILNPREQKMDFEVIKGQKVKKNETLTYRK